MQIIIFVEVEDVVVSMMRTVEVEVEKIWSMVVKPVGTFYFYSLVEVSMHMLHKIFIKSTFVPCSSIYMHVPIKHKYYLLLLALVVARVHTNFRVLPNSLLCLHQAV